MIYNHYGDRFIYNDKDYIVGETVISNNISDYANLVGVITEIRTGDDRETENGTPDIYCDFKMPIHPQTADNLRKSVQKSYADNTPMDEIAYDIVLDCVIMSPDMITTKRELNKKMKQHRYWIITEEVELHSPYDNERHEQTYVLPDKESANQVFQLLLHEIHANGFFDTWADAENYQIIAVDGYYSAVRDSYNGFDTDSYTLTMKQNISKLD